MIVVLPFLAKFLAPKEGEEILTIDKYDPTLLEEPKIEEKAREEWTLADKLENSRTISLIVCLAGFIYIGYHFIKEDLTLI